MDHKKCPNCGFINFLTAEFCRKCEKNLNVPDREYRVSAPPSGGGFPILKVCLGLFVVLIVVLTVTGVGARLLRPLSRVAWREFRPPQGGLTVMMPREPAVGEPLVTPLPSGVMTKYTYTSHVEGQGSALYCVVTFPTGISSGDLPIDKLLDDELNNVLTGTNSTLISKKRILFQGNPGLEYEIRPPANFVLKNARGFGKTIVLQHEEHFLLIYTTEDSALFSGKDKFLNPTIH